MNKFIVTQDGNTVIAVSGGGMLTIRKMEKTRKDMKHSQVEFRIGEFEVVMGTYREEEAVEAVKSYVRFLSNDDRRVFSFPQSEDIPEE